MEVRNGSEGIIWLENREELKINGCFTPTFPTWRAKSQVRFILDHTTAASALLLHSETAIQRGSSI
jgi:hypothetical protein